MDNKIIYSTLYEKIIEEIPIKPTNFVYGISFLGLPGTGKSTIASILSKKLNIYTAINDEIRRLLDNVGIDSSKNRDLVWNLSRDRIKYVLSKKTNLIIDANGIRVYESLDKLFQEYNVHLFYVKLECEEEEILKRLDYREKMFGKNNNYSRATRKDYYRNVECTKNIKFPSEKIFFTIDTMKDMNSQIDELVKRINNYINDRKG